MVIDGRPVIKEWYIERLIRSTSALTPKYCDNQSTASLLAKNETHIVLHFTGFTTKCINIAENIIVHTEWDIITPDPKSNQVIHRRMYKIEWTKTPALWKVADNLSHKAMAFSVDVLQDHFVSSSVKYLEGEPYRDPTVVNRAYVYFINQFLEDED